MPPPLPPNEENLEIFEKPAGWMLYWGTAIIVIFIVLILGLAAFIQYPDKLEFQVSISSAPPPLPLVVSYAGQIEDVLVTDGEQVTDRQVLLVLASAGRWTELQYLDSTLKELQLIDSPLNVSALRLREPLRLGKLSFAYTQLLNYTAELQEKLKRKPALQRLQYLDQQITETDNLRSLRSYSVGRLLAKLKWINLPPGYWRYNAELKNTAIVCLSLVAERPVYWIKKHA